MNRSMLIWPMPLCALMLSSCGNNGKTPPKPNSATPLTGKTIVLKVRPSGKVHLNAAVGDTVMWMSGKSAQKVTFKGKAPCDEVAGTSNKTTETCTVNQNGIFSYTCDGCGDPALVVGSDMYPFEFTRAAKGMIVESAEVSIFCAESGNGTEVDLAKITIAPTDKETESRILWNIEGGYGIKTFSFRLADGTCDTTVTPGNVIDENHKLCVLLKDAPKNQTYTVKADACSSPVTGSIKIRLN